VLVNEDEEGHEHLVPVLQPLKVFRPDVTYLITGGAGKPFVPLRLACEEMAELVVPVMSGGFGRKLFTYACLQGAKHFIISTRNPDSMEAKDVLNELIERGGTVQLVACDTAKVRGC
jgi:hypothetical protein